MASKKFRGKLCVYCSKRLADGRDHVFAREFFPPNARYNPLVVPACSECNNAKAKLEHYLTAVLPFGGRHKDASDNLSQMVPKRLKRNLSLHQALASSQQTVWVKENGLIVPAMSIAVDFQQVEELFKRIIEALCWLHFAVYLTHDDHFVTVLALNARGEQMFEQRFFRANVAARIANDVGDGAFVYEGVQGIGNPVITAWRLRIYGGLSFGGDPRQREESATMIGAMTGPRRVLTYAQLHARFASN
jgi:hypothetical protein